MKRLQVISCVAAALLAASIPTAGSMAQDAPANPTGMILVLDVAKVFEQNARFKARMEQISNDADRLKATLDSETEKLRQEAMEVAKMFKSGSPEFKSKEVELEQRNAKLRTDARQFQMELMNREARAYYDTYMEMVKYVEQIAKEYNIVLVINYDSTSINPENRGEVIAGVNRSVVYVPENLDMTGEVVRRMATATASGDNSLRR